MCVLSRLWFPCVDSQSELCLWDIAVTVTLNLVAVASGELTDQVRGKGGGEGKKRRGERRACARVCVYPFVCTSEGVTLWLHFNYCTKCVCVCVFDLYSSPAVLGLLQSQSPCSVAAYGLWALASGFCPSGVRFLFPLIVCVCLHVCVCVRVHTERCARQDLNVQCQLLLTVSCVSGVMD